MGVKLNIVKPSEKGDTVVNISQVLNFSHLAVAVITKDKDHILDLRQHFLLILLPL